MSECGLYSCGLGHEKGRDFVSVVMNLRGTYKECSFINQLCDCQLFMRIRRSLTFEICCDVLYFDVLVCFRTRLIGGD